MKKRKKKDSKKQLTKETVKSMRVRSSIRAGEEAPAK